MAFLLLIAGYETTVNLISNGLLSLLTHPDQYAALRADPALISRLGLHLLEFDRKLRRTLVSSGDRERRAFGALEVLSRRDEVPGADADAVQRLADIVRRVRIVVMPCYPS